MVNLIESVQFNYNSLSLAANNTTSAYFSDSTQELTQTVISTFAMTYISTIMNIFTNQEQGFVYNCANAVNTKIQ
jgi:hypothetical protein